MNSESLFVLAMQSTKEATDMMLTVATAEKITGLSALKTLARLRAATAAIQEIENRRIGMPEPRVG